MEKLDVLVRFHDMERVSELRRCLFSLVCQEYRPATVHILTQRFTDADTETLRSAIAPTLQIDPEVEVHIWNYTDPEPQDARSALLNLGISEAKGRYLAILDHDDTIYPHAYTRLIQELSDSGAAIAFGGIVSKTVEVLEDAFLTESRKRRYHGNDLLDLFADNFCPIHSFVLDRSAMDAKDICFSTEMVRLEDYDFLLRITAKYPASFRLMDYIVGDYFFKKDGSNTTCLGWNDSDYQRRTWDSARKAIQDRKRTTHISQNIQKMLAVTPSSSTLSIEQALRARQRGLGS